MADVLLLGPMAFTEFSAPPRMPFGGRQAMAVHKLPGGARQIDKLGADDMDIQWAGVFFGDNAYAQAMLLDGMRRAGATLPLIFGGQFFTVVIGEAVIEWERFPLLAHYAITCVVESSFNIVSALVSGVDALVGPDLDAALAF